jgi:hypothetical protein
MPAFSENSPIVRVEHLGILLRVHRRHEYLARIFDQVRKLNRARKITLSIAADRPTPDVLKVVSRELALAQKVGNRFLNVHSSPPVVSSAGARWMEPLMALHEYQTRDVEASGFGPVQAGMLLDDDALFTPAGIKELRGHLLELCYDRLDVQHLFLWDHQDRHNASVPEHWSCAVWRQYPSDHFSTAFVVKCPQRVARSSRVCRLAEPALEYGWLTQEARDAAFTAAKAAGRLDAHTLSLVRPPNLQRIHGDHPQ